MDANARAAPSRQVPWKPLLIGVAVTLVLVAVVISTSHYQPAPEGHLAQSYASQIQFDHVRVSAAETMMAGSVTYVDLTMHNLGNQTVTALTVSLTFYDPVGQVVQTEKNPLITGRTGPLGPGASRDFRLGFDHISSEWNQAPPQLRAMNIYVK